MNNFKLKLPPNLSKKNIEIFFKKLGLTELVNLSKLKISKDLSRVNIENIRVYFQNIIYFSIISGIIITPCIISFKKIVRNRLKNERSK